MDKRQSMQIEKARNKILDGNIYSIFSLGGNMVIIKVSFTNLHLITALNAGVIPNIDEENPMFLIMESGEVNRIISSEELHEISTTKKLNLRTVEIFYASFT